MYNKIGNTKYDIKDRLLSNIGLIGNTGLKKSIKNSKLAIVKEEEELKKSKIDWIWIILVYNIANNKPRDDDNIKTTPTLRRISLIKLKNSISNKFNISKVAICGIEVIAAWMKIIVLKTNIKESLSRINLFCIETISNAT